jgi:enhancing lycopene biosynthesis protein 2
MHKIAVILSGCGVMDGSEIHESVIALLAIEKEGFAYECFAPDREQPKVVNHLNNKLENEKRNMLVEAARIARGRIRDVKELNPNDFEAVILPGGFGAACNLSTFAKDGSHASVLEEVEKVLKEFHKQKKPIGAMCIAPNILAKVFGNNDVELTIGNDTSTARKLEDMGAKHIDKAADDIVLDNKNLIVTTPAYMLGTSLKEIESGITKLVKAITQLSRSKALIQNLS